jgi:hypothetical protein
MYLYFAHLETRDVERGDIVKAGQIIGTVGNTGNARSTAPHLHFGIYSNGPIDPFHFIAQTDTIADRIAGDAQLLGSLVRPGVQALMISAPAKAEVITDTLDTDTLMTLIALTGNLCCVQLPDGSSGYIAEKLVELVRDSTLQNSYPASFL